MNKENAVHFLPLVKAMALGETIQLKDYDGWKDVTSSIGFVLEPSCYRIKPKGLYVVTRKSGELIYSARYSSVEAAKKVIADSCQAGEFVVYKLVEVT